jgi:hypothetical protein
MTDAELTALLNRGGIAPALYEGEIGETNMPTWRKLAKEFQQYYEVFYLTQSDARGSFLDDNA